MHGLEVLLGHRFNRYEAHGGPTHGFTDCFGIVGIILVELHKGFDEPRIDQSHGMPALREFPRPVTDAPQASIPMRQGGKVAKKGFKADRTSRLRKITRPRLSAPWT